MVDTMGLLLEVRVHPADIQDRHGGRELLDAALATPAPAPVPPAEPPHIAGSSGGTSETALSEAPPADVPPRAEPRPLPAPEIPSPTSRRLPRLEKIWVDGAYHGVLEDYARRKYGIDIEVVSRSDEDALKMWVPPGGVPMPRAGKFQVMRRRRWVVERTFGWCGRNRRLSKDYEQNPKVSEAWIYVSMNRLMLRRLGSPPPKAG